jgi:glycosyltransferase involved in cell wall biosynthesis
MRISIIVCTRDRSSKLAQALASIERLATPQGWEWDVVVVDNGSTDATPDVCKRFVAGGAARRRYLVEQRKGKCFALNAGIKHASGDILAFTDDDCIADHAWLIAIAREYDGHSDLELLGGRVELYDSRDKATTIRTHSGRIDVSATPNSVFEAEIIGANVSFRRDVFARIGPFDPCLGPGTRCQSAEDLDYVYRAYRLGMKIAYAPDVLVYHDHGRRTDEEVRRLLLHYAIGRGAFYCKHLFRDAELLRRLFWDVRWQVAHLRWRTLYCYVVGALAWLWSRIGATVGMQE